MDATTECERHLWFYRVPTSGKVYRWCSGCGLRRKYQATDLPIPPCGSADHLLRAHRGRRSEGRFERCTLCGWQPEIPIGPVHAIFHRSGRARDFVLSKNASSKKNFAFLLFYYFNKCAYCNKDLHHNNRSVDHVIPSSDNGSNHISNLVPACRECNHAKGSMSCKDFCGKEWPPYAELRPNRQIPKPKETKRDRDRNRRLRDNVQSDVDGVPADEPANEQAV